MKPIIDTTLSALRRVGATDGNYAFTDASLRPLDLELLCDDTCYLLLYCKRGSISGYLNNVYIEVSPSSMLFISPGDRFYCFDDNEPAVLFGVCVFSSGWVPNYAIHALGIIRGADIGHLSLLAREGALVEDSLVTIARRSDEGGDMCDDIISSLLTVLLCDIATFFARESASSHLSKPKRLCLKFCRLIHSCGAMERQLSYYARELCVTQNHLSYVCRQELGYPAGRYIDEAVALRCRYHLLFTDSSMADISRDMGFANQSFFGKFFKRRFGISPIHFRGRYLRKGLTK